MISTSSTTRRPLTPTRLSRSRTIATRFFRFGFPRRKVRQTRGAVTWSCLTRWRRIPRCFSSWEKNPEVWMRKLDWIAQNGGMVLVNTHPDYMDFQNRWSLGEYPVKLYQEFLEYVRAKYAGQFWHASPRQVASFARAQVPDARPVKEMAPVNNDG